MLILFDENQERNEYDSNIYYEDLLNEKDYGDIVFLHKSEEKIVIQDIKLNKKLVIKKESIGNIKKLVENNTNFNTLNGYGYKIGDYIEFDLYSFISVNLFDYNIMDNVITFNIGNVKILIKSSSEMYRCLRNLEYGYETNTDDYVMTMSLYGITNNNYADYVNMALFILRSIPKDEDNNTSIYGFIDEHINDINFEDVRYNEVFYFYNEAMRIIDTEISVLYFYKIIEYFFLFIRKGDFKRIIDEYIVDKNIDSVITKLVKIYNEKEKFQLKLLLESLEDEIVELMTKANSLNIISSPNITDFAGELYSFRNSIVHGKSGDKFDLKLPNPLAKNNNELFWKDTVKSIAEILIRKFCIKIKY